MQDISLILKDAHHTVRVYATPMGSHALQVYQSVPATCTDCNHLEYERSGHMVTPRLMSQKTFGWSLVLQEMEGHTS
jgi:hypothetical protein